MLSLILGRAGTGKTMFVLDDIRQKMVAGESNMLLIVPEQYSHDAEKQLCAVCGDRISMHGETLSFTRLCARVFSEVGGAPENMLDAGGQTLIMYRAAESVEGSLKAFKPKGLRTEMLLDMLDGVKELKSQRLSPPDLERIAEQATNPLRDKLHDLALINDSYDALIRAHGGDTPDRMALLADTIGESTAASSRVYFDGFNDFTAQELRVIEKLLWKKAEITICLTCDMEDDSEVFVIPRKTVGQLRRIAEKYGVQITTTQLTTRDARHLSLWPINKSPELVFLEKYLFAHKTANFEGKRGAITLYAAPSRHAECEYAAQKALEFARKGYRWRDIGVMARDWEVYNSICESVFEKNGIPYFSSGRADILDKAPVALIDAALSVAVSGWEYKTALRYLKTGLAGISADACAEIENYVITWNIRGSMWNRDWKLPMRGYGSQSDNEASARLNDLRLRIVKPIIRLRDGIKGVSRAGIKLGALYRFLEDISLPERIMEKAEEFEKRGEARLAREYGQIWDIISNSMEQMYGLLGEGLLEAAEFRKLFMLSLSRYDVGVIPISLDRTALGGMEMSRRRELKCLIILGATDENMPMLAKGGGVLSDNERMELKRFDADIPGGLEDRLSREMNMIYSTLTLPSDELVVIYPNSGGERSSFFVKRVKEMFGISETTPKPTRSPPIWQEALACATQLS
ncbi:MAG: hypothetical protein FWH57_09615, partial [Oscillospiraceae bacterium]|nr:hypothetical protein [Oscillospiraceae bacterium]